MKSTQLLQHKNYYGSVNIDIENNMLYGKVEFVRALITYEGKDAEGLANAFREAVEEYLSFCQEKGIEPEQPFKGSLNIRLGEERHRRAWQVARALDKSLNEYICLALDESFKKSQTPIKPKMNIKYSAKEERKPFSK